MGFEQEWPPRLVELFYLIEEKKVERFLAPSLSKQKNQFESLERLYSCKYFRIFHKTSNINQIQISISKKFFKLAVERNKIKRQIKEIYRALPDEVLLEGVLVFSVFRPFGELSYDVASSEIAAAFENILKKSLDKV
tara:strand:+ start:2025 stop:2435 length:411 start_codon:yes stop_codon:yes gene_type:complete